MSAFFIFLSYLNMILLFQTPQRLPRIRKIGQLF